MTICLFLVSLYIVFSEELYSKLAVKFPNLTFYTIFFIFLFTFIWAAYQLITFKGCGK